MAFKTLFVLGNGFDINLDLKTGYREFYEKYGVTENDNLLVKTLKKEIAQSKYENWADLERGLGNYTIKLKTNEEVQIVFEDIKSEFIKYLKSEEENFDLNSISIDTFSEYLLYPERSLPNSYLSLINEFKGGQPSLPEIVTFNYTKSAEWILKKIERNNSSIVFKDGDTHLSVKSPEDVYHIHGDLDEGIVLGVNDSSQISNEELLKSEGQVFKSYLIKPEFNKNLANGVDNKFQELIKEVRLICVYGCSIGVTDKLWWKKIGERLLIGDCKLVLFIYDSNIKPETNHRKPYIKDLYLEKFLDLAEIEMNKRQEVKEHIIIGVNRSLFSRI